MQKRESSGQSATRLDAARYSARYPLRRKSVQQVHMVSRRKESQLKVTPPAVHSMFTKPVRSFTWRSQTGPCRHGFFPTPRTTTSPSVPPPPSPKLAVFDLDGVLIKTKFGAFPPHGPSDWKWWHPTKVPNKLRAMYDDG